MFDRIAGWMALFPLLYVLILSASLEECRNVDESVMFGRVFAFTVLAYVVCVGTGIVVSYLLRH